MPNIPFPAVPPYPGVPLLPRPITAGVATTPVVAIGIGTLSSILGNALQQAPQWGIFDSSGNQLGGFGGGTSIISSLVSQVTGARTPVLSTLSFEWSRETSVANFPLEQGSFASYNKVQNPANPVVTLALSG